MATQTAGPKIMTQIQKSVMAEKILEEEWKDDTAQLCSSSVTGKHPQVGPAHY